MAFIDDSDLNAEPPAQAQVVYQPAPRSKLVPVLLIVVIIALVSLTFVLALPYLKSDGGSGDASESPAITVADLDPESLMTPTGRKLDVVEFGGFIFEITRFAYSTSPRSRTITITVPGKPPQMGVFHINESFAGGKIRVVDITRETVVLEANGQQKMFTVPGADPAAMWERAPSGMQLVPPTENGAIPDLPDGVTRPPRHPMADTETPGGSGSDTGEGFDSLEDLPLVIQTTLKREDYNKLRLQFLSLLESDLVLHTDFERETRQPNGLEIKNILNTSLLYAYGLERGDIIYALNGQTTYTIEELTLVARTTNNFNYEIRIDIARGNEVITFVIVPGVPD